MSCNKEYYCVSKDPLSVEEIWHAFDTHREGYVMMVSRHGTQCINNVLLANIFEGSRPLSTIPCTRVSNAGPIFSHRNIKVIFTKNRDHRGHDHLITK